MSAPWLKFFPSDWRADPALRICSVTARGLWMEMLCLMHSATPRGFLLVNGNVVTARQLAALAGSDVDEVQMCLAELEAAGVFSRDADGTIYSRRMRRDEQKFAEDKANGKLGGNPSLMGGDNPPENPPDKAQKLEARRQTPDPSSLRSDGRADAPTARGSSKSKATRIPDDWQPDRQAARDLGIPEAKIDWIAGRFRDFWRGKAGKDGVKLDWLATWRNWCRSDAEKNGWTPAGEVIPMAQPPPEGAEFVEHDSSRWHEISARLRAKGRLMPPATRVIDGKKGAFVQIGEAA